jgi:high-affinity Fe2+/Pb2+ permease
VSANYPAATGDEFREPPLTSGVGHVQAPEVVEHAHAHNPLVAHQFDDLAQQKEAGILGMWSFLATEIMFFGGALLAYAIYRGAVTLNMAKFFTVTGVLLIFVAAGILAYGVHDLQEARILPGLYTLAFDVSNVIPADSWYGTLLKGIFNFSPQTTVFEAVVWVAYVAVVLTLFIKPARRTATSPRDPATSASSAA